jgi:tyrosyl-tRNA synthetase
MANVDVFQQLVDRGFMKQCTNEDALRELLQHSVVTFYAGFDPTAESLHVGSLMPITAMADLQRAGHRPIAIIGGGTTMIGDPSGKTETRRIMSGGEIESNGKGILSQLQRYLTLNETDGLFANNADWLLPLSYIQFLREIGRHFKVNEMIRVDTYKQRLEQELGLSFIEFNYQLLQAYDFLHLFQQHKCLLQVGGDDQWSNILAGVNLTKQVANSSVYGLTFPLLTTALGQKMGKTEKGTVWLDSKKTPPYDFYQYWVNVHDDDAKRFLALFTFLPMSDIEALTEVGGENLRQAKQVLAFEVTKLAHGETEATRAQEAAQAAFSGVGGDLSQLPAVEIAASRLSRGVSLVDFMTEVAITSSRTEARRLINQKGISINGVLITSCEECLSNAFLQNGVIILRRGKKNFYRIVTTT